MSMGTRYGKVIRFKYRTARCLITQFTIPLFAESIAFWNIVITVSGRSSTRASCEQTGNISSTIMTSLPYVFIKCSILKTKKHNILASIIIILYFFYIHIMKFKTIHINACNCKQIFWFFLFACTGLHASASKVA